MKLPGEALLEFQLKPLNNETTELTQTARFLPKGLAGIAYWYAITPLHAFVFNGMLRGIATAGGAKVSDITKKFLRRSEKESIA